MKKKRIREYTHDNIRYGIYDRPIDDDPFEEDDELISPSPQMSTQLSVDMPSVEDSEYTPQNPKELSKAASVIAQRVPNENVSSFYNDLLKALDKALDLDDMKHSDKHEYRFKEENMEESIGKRMNKSIREISDLPQSYSKSAKSDPSGLASIASEMGLSVSGANILIRKILEKLKIVVGVPAEELDDAEEMAARMFRNVVMNKIVPREEQTPGILEDTFGIDREGFVTLADNPLDSDIFKKFFAISYIAPAYKKLMNKKTKDAREYYTQLGYPRPAFNMVVNQLRGLTDKNPRAMREKFKKAVIDSFATTNPELKTDYEKEEAASRIYSSLIADMPDIRQKLVPESGEFISIVSNTSPVGEQEGLSALVDSFDQMV